MSHSTHASSTSSISFNYGFPEEDLRQEGKGNLGYFPARLGQLLENGRFSIVRKLGWGNYASVWLAKDNKEQHFVALKILTREATESMQVPGSDELRMLEKIASAQPNHRGFKHNLLLHGSFELRGPQGTHLCIFTEVLVSSVNHVRESNGSHLPSLASTKRLTKQLLLSLEYLHDVCGIVHTGASSNLIETAEPNETFPIADIKHDNILFRHPDVLNVISHELVANPSEIYDLGTDIYSPLVSVVSQALPLSTDGSCTIDQVQAVLADFGRSCWKEHRCHEMIQPSALRAPEVILGYPWGTPADIWNLGCLVMEWLVGFWLFETLCIGVEWGREEDHLARMTETVGAKFDLAFLAKCKRRDEFFNEDGSFKRFTIHEEPNCPLDQLLKECALVDLEEKDVVATARFVQRCLQLIPEERPSARELLEDPWLIGV
ncbi:hypothetical protein VNI00_004879 [Paramarasmius palmivorus]|uniref:non-specific serine/threonine protein kinase n=1 Tax=Paramarasmius palmivorus TaxID=297713 RepID=A0AAW0DF68_9AGAR